MKKVFADTLYWLALVKPGDQWKTPADQAKKALGAVVLVTTDEVLTEFLNGLSGGGSVLRGKAVETVRAIMSNPNVRVVPQSRDTFQRAMERYENRRDKSYSLVDCASMNAMNEEKIVEVLTADPHFEQEGFTALIKK